MTKKRTRKQASEIYILGQDIEQYALEVAGPDYKPSPVHANAVNISADQLRRH